MLFASVFIFAQISSRSKLSISLEFDAVLYAPWAQIVKSESVDQFMQSNERLFQDWDNSLASIDDFASQGQVFFHDEVPLAKALGRVARLAQTWASPIQT